MATRKAKHICVAALPDGKEARRVTTQKYTHALCVPQVGKSGLWVVLRWSKAFKLLSQEAKRREKQSNGERAAVVVRVEIETR